MENTRGQEIYGSRMEYMLPRPHPKNCLGGKGGKEEGEREKQRKRKLENRNWGMPTIGL